MQRELCALARDRLIPADINAAKIATIAMTTNNSVRVNPRPAFLKADAFFADWNDGMVACCLGCARIDELG